MRHTTCCKKHIIMVGPLVQGHAYCIWHHLWSKLPLPTSQAVLPKPQWTGAHSPLSMPLCTSCIWFWNIRSNFCLPSAPPRTYMGGGGKAGRKLGHNKMQVCVCVWGGGHTAQSTLFKARHVETTSCPWQAPCRPEVLTSKLQGP